MSTVIFPLFPAYAAQFLPDCCFSPADSGFFPGEAGVPLRTLPSPGGRVSGPVGQNADFSETV